MFVESVLFHLLVGSGDGTQEAGCVADTAAVSLAPGHPF
jgi:hypothetical protein